MTFMQYRKKPARHPWQVLISDRRCIGVNKTHQSLIINTLRLYFRTKVHYKNHPSCPMQLHFCRLAGFANGQWTMDKLQLPSGQQLSIFNSQLSLVI